jgi:cyanophycinase
MMIKPLYLLADSQLLFCKDNDRLFTERIREQLHLDNPQAAYLGASNGDSPEFYSLFQEAMGLIGITNCRMIPSSPLREDASFLEAADLILLAGGDVQKGWNVFEQNGVKDTIMRRRYDGSVLVGVSAGAVQLGLGSLTEGPKMEKLDLFRFAPFYVGAHEENEEWWNLRVLVNLSLDHERGIGIPFGGGAVYTADGLLEPIRKPLLEFSKEGDRIAERLLLPEPPLISGNQC